MKRLLTTVLLATFIFFNSYGQQSKFGKVSIAELEKKNHDIEVDASAAILFQKRETFVMYDESNDEWERVTEVYRRIKIYDAQASQWGDVTIALYKNDKMKEEVKHIKAMAYSLDGKKIIESKLEGENIYEEEVSDYWTHKKFAIPNIKDGTIIEYKYKTFSPFIYRIPRWDFQYSIPVNETIYMLETPDFFSYEASSTGVIPIEVENSIKNKVIRFRYDYNPRRGRNKNKKKTSEKFEYKANVIKMKARNTPSMSNVLYVLSTDMYRSSIQYELLLTEMPNGSITYFTKSWDEIAGNLMESKSFGGEINRKIDDFDQLIQEVEGLSDMKKINEIYRRIQDEFTWNEKYRVAPRKGIKELIKVKTGDCAAINLLLINLLKRAGVPVHPIVSRIRSEGILNTAYPTIADLNYVFAGCQIGDELIFLDATDKFLNVGELPLHAISLSGVMLKGKSGVPLNIDNPNVNKETYSIVANINPDKSINCDESIRFKDHAASQFRSITKNINDENAYIDYMQNKYENVEYSSFVIENKDDKDKQIKIASSFTLDEGVEEIGGKIYIDPLLVHKHKTNPFVSELRNFPVFYDAKLKRTALVSFLIPDGYKVESMPEKLSMSLPSNQLSYIYEVREIGNKINVNSVFSIKNDIILSEDYGALKNFYSLVINANLEKIVLVKN